MNELLKIKTIDTFSMTKIMMYYVVYHPEPFIVYIALL